MLQLVNHGDSPKPYIKTTDRLDIPRLDYSGGSTTPTLLLEGQRTNLVTDSNANFIINQCTIAYNDTTSPEGITNAYKATATGTSGSFVRTGNISFADPTAFSVFFKYGNNQWLQIINSGSVNHYVNVDIQNGTFGTNGSDTSDLLAEDYENGWYRISGKFSGYSGNGTLRVYMGSTSNAGWAGATAIIDNYYYGYGFQVESNASFKTSYIPTSGTSVTRNDESFVADSLGTIIGQTEGCIFIDFVYYEGDRFEIFNASSTADGFLIYRSGTAYNLQVGNGGSYWAITNFITGLTIGTRYKLAINYKLNDYKIFVNGSQVATSTSIEVPTTNKIISSRQNGTFKFTNHINEFMMFNQYLTNDELETLTTI